MTDRSFLLIDTMNMLHRCRHMVSSNSGINEQIGMAFHYTFLCLKKAARLFPNTHLVFALDGVSWRKSIFPDYKLNRKVIFLKKTPTEQENETLFLEAASDFCEFLKTKTNATVAECPIAEADDMIALWIAAHPDDNHIIMSSDSDFYQLLTEKVCIYDGMKEIIVTHEAVLNESRNPAVNKSNAKPIPPIDPEYHLFEKCIRGDRGDNIFSAYPGVRKKGSKTKTGILEAFADRKAKGFAWNNFMNQRWTDHNEIEHIVKDTYAFNQTLIDLTRQPEDVKAKCLMAILSAYDEPTRANVGIHFMKFCGRWDLKKISDNATVYAKMLHEHI